MKIIAIHPGHNATVALADNGEILGILSQEKCDNVKNSAVFPSAAIAALLEELEWDMKDIDEVVVSGNQVYPARAYEYLYDAKNKIVDTSSAVTVLKKMRDGNLGRMFPQVFGLLKKFRSEDLVKQGIKELRKNIDDLGLTGKKITHVEHHECHARAAYHSFEKPNSGKPALIFTMDGSGDDLCATVTQVDGHGNWKRIASTPAAASLGGIYSNTTRFLGMKILEHEYKVMGLAAYAKKSYMLETYEHIFKPVIWISKNNPLVFESSVNASTFYDYLVDHAVGERFDNMAAALQHLTEELVVQWIKNAIEQTGIHRVFTGGGVFMNVKLNRRIQEMNEVEQVFFMPSCGDESNPIGACYYHATTHGQKTKPLANLYLGVSYSDGEIESFITKKGVDRKYTVTRSDDIEATVAELLADREIVARFSGRCEWGARSLGNSAILAHPSHMESFYTVNDYIKCRDFWMPFAPSMLDTAAPKYLKDYNPNKAKAPHMITAYAATDLAVEHLRAALHQGDHTLRPQVVEEAANPSYYRLIQLFEGKTGVGAVLNTSFNLHGYPLVSKPEQALMTLEQSGLRHLAMGSFLISKKQDA